MAEAQFTITVSWERLQGKFAGRDEIIEIIEQALQEAEGSIDITGIGADGDSEYEVTSFDVSESTPPQGYDAATKRVREYLAAATASNPNAEVTSGFWFEGKTYKLKLADLHKLVNR